MKYIRYPKYKDSDVAWLGEVPKHWGTVRMKLNSYIKARVGWHGLSSEEHQDEGPYLVTGTDFEEGGIDWDSCVHVSVERYKQDPYIILRDGDLLITKDGTIGKTAVVDGLGVKQATLNSGVFVIRPLQNAYSTSFLYWVFNSQVFTGFISLESAGSTIQHLYQRTLNEFSFPEVPHHEQDAINAFLDRETTRIDALIEKKQRLIELLKEKRQAVITQAVTKGLDPNVPMKDSGVEWLGEVPEHWCVMQIGYLLDRIEQGKSPQCESRPAKGDEWGVLKTGCVNGGKYSAHENKAMPQNEDPHSQYEVKVGDVLMSRASGSIDLIGSAAFVAKTPPRILLSDKIFRLKYNEKVSPEYLVMVLGSRPSRQQIELSINGAEGLANNITKPSIMAIRIGVPQIHEQTQIVQEAHRQVLRIDQIQEKTEKSVSLLKEHRSALITAAVTGQIDVRNLA